MPAIELYSSYGNAPASPASIFFAITPNDTTDLQYVTRGIRVGAAGDVTAVRVDGTAVLFKGCSVGELLPIRAWRILATGTTASSLVGLV